GEAGVLAVGGQVAEGAIRCVVEWCDSATDRVDQVDRSARCVKKDVAADPERAMLDGRPALRPGIRTDRAADFGRLLDNAGIRSLRAGVDDALSIRIEGSPHPGVAVGADHHHAWIGGAKAGEILNTAISMEGFQDAAMLDNKDACAASGGGHGPSVEREPVRLGPVGSDEMED